jgi:hypothetical protein
MSKFMTAINYKRNYFLEAHQLLKTQGYKSYIQNLLPRGKWKGREWIAINPTRNDKNLGSFCINCLNGKWKDFAVNIKGITLLEACFYIGVARPEAKRGQSA